MCNDTTSTPLVSVIIPCYNHAEYVQECIQSVIDQDYANIELIIIDDGSKDSSILKIEEMLVVCEERFVRFEFRYRANQGLCATLNEALEWCEGLYTASVASDDVWMEHKTSKQVQYLNQNLNCIGVFGGIIFINQLGQRVNDSVRSSEKYTFDDIFLHNHFLPAPTSLCRTVKLKQYKYDPNLKIEDWDMWLKLTSEDGTLDYIADNYAFYRRHDSNLSKNLDIMHRGRLEIIEQYHAHMKYKEAIAVAYLASYFESDDRKIYFLQKAVIYFPPVLFSSKFLKALKECIGRFVFRFMSKIK